MYTINEDKLRTKVIGRKIRYYDEIDSTNLEAKRFQYDRENDGMVFVAEQQIAGRGRMGRSWVSSKETGLWFSILLMPQIDPVKASMLTLPAALAAADAINHCTGIKSEIKWPNDVIIHNKKVCGILTEMITSGGKIQEVIIGIGINVNMKIFPADIMDKATSLCIEGGRQYERGQLLVELLNQFEKYYDDFCRYENLKNCVDSYNSLLINKGKKVRIIEKEHSYEAKALRIDETGCLLIERDDGIIKKIMSGEVSVRGLYGYV